ncbi:hypothetical protein [uncultured Desulfobacter sp.]|uniref:hypothetical protein n=1 Tax=uncultured Desulfobacter sp. TaxID=240139 RepID=UPI002AAC489B|nr:hypothetical protein [uncultured Desulfobacter sp.]
MIAALKHNENNVSVYSGMTQCLDRISAAVGLKDQSADGFVQALPFMAGDATAGAENEFQAVVAGKREDIDLARVIETSNYYRNLVEQARTGETPQRRVMALERLLKDKDGKEWENSWVWFPRRVLNRFANQVFNKDLKADKSIPTSEYRRDAANFVFEKNGENHVRVPVSYLLKLALADAIGEDFTVPEPVKTWGEKMLSHFSNDNSSPELFSFYPVKSDNTGGVGEKLAAETLLRFLLTQALVAYAGHKFELHENGQNVKVFFSATPPGDQKRLNDVISDAFYRELFMSPCLSGWDRGEDKKEYMSVCHKVLSRSQLNAVAQIKEAGIINSNLVVLPNTSNISLANNGTHVSLGSVKLSQCLSDPGSGFTARDEKYTGDLAIKIWEHFLPLFATTYSAAPHRFDFPEFHPERVLGFMPHELTHTHLRMIWRRWKKKAHLKIMGHSLTPFGPVWLDRLIANIFRLKGDFIPDGRLIDYFTSVMSTFQSPALNGSLESETSLKKDLTEMGVFDGRMALYQLVRLRKYHQMGYSGFEHRYFSVFEDVVRDMGKAADLQVLITALTQKYIYSRKIDHAMIPDSPDVESERRQIFFCTAIGIPTFFVKTRTRNQFLAKILKNTAKTRQSHRYPGYTRVLVPEYQRALISLIQTEAPDLVAALNGSAILEDLENRINTPQTHAAWGRITQGILNGSGKQKPMSIKGSVFNEKAESYYGKTLRESHISQGFDLLGRAFEQMDLWARYRDSLYGKALGQILGSQDILKFLKSMRQDFMDDTCAPETLKKFIYLMVLVVSRDMQAWQNGE